MAASKRDYWLGSVLVVLISIASTAIAFLDTLNIDVSWLLHATSEKLQGGQLCRDAMEIYGRK